MLGYCCEVLHRSLQYAVERMNNEFFYLISPLITVEEHFMHPCTLVPLNSSSINTVRIAAIIDLENGVADPLYFIEEIAFAFCNIIHHIDIA